VFVIFGFQRKPQRLATIRSICAGCQDRGSQELFSVRKRFRLFFVPAVPLPTTYQTTCVACGTSSAVSAEKADLLLASAPLVDEPQVIAA
jgi:hypothetical protein